MISNSLSRFKLAKVDLDFISCFLKVQYLFNAGFDRVFRYKGSNSFGGVNKVQLFEWMAKKGWVLNCCFGDKFLEEYIFIKSGSSIGSTGGGAVAGGGGGSRAMSSTSRAGTSMGDNDDW